MMISVFRLFRIPFLPWLFCHSILMILQMPWGGERVNAIRKNRPERPQHILNYSRINRHASWAFLPKNSPSLGVVTIFFSGSDRTPPPYVRHLRPATPLSETSMIMIVYLLCIHIVTTYPCRRLAIQHLARQIIASIFGQFRGGISHIHSSRPEITMWLGYRSRW